MRRTTPSCVKEQNGKMDVGEEVRKKESLANNKHIYSSRAHASRIMLQNADVIQLTEMKGKTRELFV